MKIFRYFLFSIFISTNIFANLELTEKEKAWLQDHPVIRVSNETNWPPYDFKETKPEGYAIDLLRIIESRLGVEFKFISSSSWGRLVEMAEKRQIDVIHPLAFTEDRAEYLNFTTPILELIPVLAVRKDFKPLHKIEDLAGYKLGIIPSFSYHRELMEDYPEINFVQVVSPAHALTHLSAGRIDAYADSLGSVNYFIEKFFLTNIEIKSELEFDKFGVLDMRVGIRNDWPEFYEIFQKALDSITEDEKVELRRKWIFSYKDIKYYNPNQTEKAKLSNHRIIRLKQLGNIPPIAQVNRLGNREGILYEYFKILEGSLNLMTTIIEKKEYTNDDVDLIFPVAKTDSIIPGFGQRIKLTETPISICFNKKYNIFSNFTDLSNEKIGMLREFKDIPELATIIHKNEITYYDNIQEGLVAVFKSNINIFYGPSYEVTYHLNKNKSLQLKTIIDPEIKFGYYVAVSDNIDWIIPIIEKTLLSVDDYSHQQITKKWTSFTYEQGINWNIIVTFILSVIFASGIIILFFTFKWKKLLDISKTQEKIHSRLSENEVEYKNRIKDTQLFVAKIMHELKNQLNPLAGFVELLDLTPLNEKQKNYLKQIDLSRSSLLDLLQKIDYYIKISSKENILEKDLIETKNFISIIENNFTSKAHTKNIELIIKVSEDFPDFFHINYEALMLVINELLKNAVEFTSSGFVEIDFNKYKSPKHQAFDLELIISDSGIGFGDITTDTKDTTEDFFAHAEKVSSGLGLPLVYAVIKKLNGSVKFKSTDGKGSQFKIRCYDIKYEINNPQDLIKTKEELEMEKIIFENSKILIADDIKYNITVIKRLLNNSGLDFTEVYNGRKVFEQLKINRPDLIFLDMRMPNVDGFEIAEKIKETPEFSDIPVIATSSSPEIHKKVISLRVCDGYLQKPYKKADIYRELMRFLPYTKT
ncbi:MAG: transporter substrate-binding domain-containing protein [Spirochaetales bacterium]|nr:transporter substrate-binding domain-containing protein [Spirochaetales bacterium]